MGFGAKLLADSVGTSRLTTLELTFPRIVLAEFNTHRMFSRNAASSRAIPVSKMIDRVLEDPFIPIHWGKAQKGMQAFAELDGLPAEDCRELWLDQRDKAVATVRALLEIGLHKQIANRLLEPWMWVTVIASSTNWSNFFALRCHGDAEPHINMIACLARDLIVENTPKTLAPFEWHMPLVDFDGDEELSMDDKIAVSVGRCARVSYLTHDGRRDITADIELHDRLKQSGHWSPFEHVAQFVSTSNLGGNFGSGWRQYRKMFLDECR